MIAREFAAKLLDWQRQHGRHDLPWQVSDPYRIWLSEIMLQQTQVSSVLVYYTRFIEHFPDVAALAQASVDEVVTLWSGLGYYSRARNLHKAAIMVCDEFNGAFPESTEALIRLPGVGRSTAAAIAAFAFSRRNAILDGNVKRVLARVFGISGWPGEKKIENTMWQLAENLLPSAAEDMPGYTQGIMDLGATVCTRGKPACGRCPMRDDCIAHQNGRTGELPTARPKKAIPTRYATLIMAVHKGQILLERRPPTGIWGGLLSLPELGTAHNAEDWLGKAGDGDILPAWPEIEHVFTHFRLIITPLPLDLSALHPQTRDSNACWLPLHDAANAGVPAPVKRMLERLAATSGKLTSHL
ncbi:A/G-specific adenine glycosylase [Craterilacuibacter sp.]|uniref:A/G-specific adenine glycosylase n=1 Tax=Craterilacuibacter sp. TaxID=2870909 RepID=UPI003F38B3B9